MQKANERYSQHWLTLPIFWGVVLSYAVFTIMYFWHRASWSAERCEGRPLEHFLCDFLDAGVPFALLVVAPTALLVVYVVVFGKSSAQR